MFFFFTIQALQVLHIAILKNEELNTTLNKLLKDFDVSNLIVTENSLEEIIRQVLINENINYGEGVKK